MNELQKLSQLVTSRNVPPIGTVLRVIGDDITVQTSKGTYTLPRAGTRNYSIGEKVVISEGFVVGALEGSASIPVYYV